MSSTGEFSHAISDLITILAFAITFLTSSIPTLAHLGVSVIFLLSKLFSPVVYPVLKFILIRFYEQPKGIFTSIGLCIVAVSALLKIIVPYFTVLAVQ